MKILIIVSLAVVILGVSAATAGAHGSAHSEPVGTLTHTDFLDEAPALGMSRPGRLPAAKATASGGRGAAWCGTAGGGGAGSSAPSISLVYAVPSDQRSRFRQVAGMLQRGVTTIGRYIALESGQRKTIRFETGTSCGPQYVRIQFVRLRGPRVSYLDSNGAPAMATVRAELKEVLPASAGPRNWLVYVDGLVDRASGWAEVLEDDTPGSTNRHNAGGLFAFVWGERQVPPSRLQVPYYAYLMLHELTHNLGGVQASAPNASGAWHCTDGFDVMCYDDGGTAQQPIACRRAGVLGAAYDCNQDDYFNPSPAPGSYLATHWNVYDSAFLGSCRELRAACGPAAVSTRASRDGHPARASRSA